jgi:hypothetical protein
MNSVNQSPCAIQIDQRGVMTFEIADAEGEVHSYSVEPAAALCDEWACEVRRLDGEGESPYRVSLSLTGSWRCSCPDAVYRARKQRRFCKHQAACVPFYLNAKRLLGGAKE